MCTQINSVQINNAGAALLSSFRQKFSPRGPIAEDLHKLLFAKSGPVILSDKPEKLKLLMLTLNRYDTSQVYNVCIIWVNE